MSDPFDGARILIYSHDSFGLGHLRRCRAIAHALVEHHKGLSVLILSGSPIIGSFDFRARVDFVRIPGVIKLHNGEYTSLGLHIDLEQTLAMRESIIRHTAEIFAPDIFLVDKEPLGLKGEVHGTLQLLKRQGTRLVLGLRDVMDSPAQLRREWRRKQAMGALAELYDEIWVYGLEAINDPLAGLTVPAGVRDKMLYTGYLRRTLPHAKAVHPAVNLDEPYLLVTPGGGGDGAEMVDWVIRAYAADPELPWRALIVFGPFMAPALRHEFRSRIAQLPRLTALDFDTDMEQLMARATGIVAMGGYNTFCEILSFDKRALLIPRTRPRQEQYLRASRAQKLGLVRMLDPAAPRNAALMARALRALPAQPLPSEAGIPGLLDGLDTVSRLVAEHLGRRRPHAQTTPSGRLRTLA
ncbi:MAG TPA: glycosyltransferase [Candidatus Competibacteraceae bacterium]|nr:glycosyltransferase [Candidatus Competibacteraceae bacterium]